MLVDVIIDTDEYYIEQPDLEDSWDMGKRGLTINSVRVRATDGRYGEEFPGDFGDTCYVVVERYYDGCTFGSSEYVDVKGVFVSRKEAQRWIENRGLIDHGYFGSHISFDVHDVVVGRR